MAYLIDRLAKAGAGAPMQTVERVGLIGEKRAAHRMARASARANHNCWVQVRSAGLGAVLATYVSERRYVVHLAKWVIEPVRKV